MQDAADAIIDLVPVAAPTVSGPGCHWQFVFQLLSSVLTSLVREIKHWQAEECELSVSTNPVDESPGVAAVHDIPATASAASGVTEIPASAAFSFKLGAGDILRLRNSSDVGEVDRVRFTLASGLSKSVYLTLAEREVLVKRIGLTGADVLLRDVPETLWNDYCNGACCSCHVLFRSPLSDFKFTLNARVQVGVFSTIVFQPSCNS
jgi:hypothetical protein